MDSKELEEKAKLYARTVSGVETYQTFLKKAFIAGYLAKDGFANPIVTEYHIDVSELLVKLSEANEIADKIMAQIK